MAALGGDGIDIISLKGFGKISGFLGTSTVHDREHEHERVNDPWPGFVRLINDPINGDGAEIEIAYYRNLAVANPPSLVARAVPKPVYDATLEYLYNTGDSFTRAIGAARDYL